MQLVVVIAAIFVVPKLMSVLPDFDPLMMIVGLFAVLALAQHLGFQGGGDGEAPSSSAQRVKRRQQEASAAAEAEEESAEAGTERLLKDATRAMEQNNYERARELAQRATDADPECARAWELLATAQKWQGDRGEAAATVRKAQEMYEVDSEGLRQLARELAGGGSPRKTATECEKKGEEFFSKRQYDLAVDCYTKALDALLGDGSGDGTGAADVDCKELLLRLRRRRAECSQQLQDWGTCRRDATALLEEDPSDQRALMQRAAANEALEKFKDALADARKLLSFDPKNTAANRIAHNSQQALRG